MKKILGMAGLLIAAVIFAYTFRLKTVGYLDTSVMAVTDRQMTGTLKAGISDHEDRRIVTLQKYQAAEPLYSRGNRYYLGQEKTQLDISYPFYVNSGTSLYFMTDQTKLITSDFAVFDSYNGLFLSDGKAYTSQDGSSDMMELADEEEYIMTSIGGGVYQNLQPMKVTSDSKENDYRLNSFLYLDDNVIRAYSYEDDVLVYTENPVSVSSRVSIGSLNMSYSEFLGYLKTAAGSSDFSTGIDIDRQDQTNTDLNEERSHEEGQRQTADSKPQEAPAADPAVAANGIAGAAGGDVAGLGNGDEGQNPENSQSDGGFIDSGNSDNTGSTNGEGDEGSGGSGGDMGGGDSGGSGGGSNGGSSDRNNGSSGGTSGSGSGAANGSGDGNGAGDGSQDGGNHDSGTNGGNGSNGGQNSGSGSGQGQGNGGEKPSNPDDDIFHEPKVTMDAPEMGVYYLKSSIHIDDPDGRLVRVVIRAYLNGKQGGRKNLKSDADFKILNLRPGETYEIKGEMVYRNELGVKVTKPFMENIEVKTKSLDTLAPLTLNFEDADTYATQSISIKNMTLTGTTAKDDADEVLIDYVSRVKVTVKGYEDQNENLGSTLVRKLRQGEKISWTSGDDFKSNKSYDYQVDIQDRFGNSLQLTTDSRTDGHTRTCKVTPTASIVELDNQVGTQTVGVQISNPDQVSLSNLRLKVVDLEGNVLPAFSDSDSYYYPLDPTASGRQDVNITMLPTGIDIVVIVEADFDLGDKPQANYLTQREIGRRSVYTAPISILGTVYANITTADVTASSVNVTFTIDQGKTQEGLLSLLTQARVLISSLDGTIVYNSMAGDGTHLGGVGQSSEMTSGKIDVGLKSNYLLDKERLGENGWSKENDGSFIIQKSNSVDSTPQVKVYQPSDQNCDNPWEALKLGGRVMLSFPRKSDQFTGSFQSMTRYQITVQAVATQAGISHSVGNTGNVSSFRTLRQAPVFEYSDAFTIADQYSIYGFRINDPDGTIPGGQVQMRISTNGSVVMVRNLTTNTEEPEDLVIPDLRQGNTYLITFMTTLYNEGYDSSTQGEKTFDQQFQFTVGEEASGTIQLNGLNKDMLSKIQVSMSGKNGALINYQYQVQIYGAAGVDTANAKVLQNRIGTWEYKDLELNMDGFAKVYDYQCNKNWKYIMRLVVNVRGYQVILDDVSFTTEGEIIAITTWEDIKEGNTVIQKGLRTAMNENKTGKFVVTQDMVKNSNNTVGSSTSPFNGTLDFQGHTMTTEVTNADGSKTYYGAPMFDYLGSEGVVENIVYDWTWDNSVYASYSSFYRWASLVRWNWGTIRNVKIDVNMRGRQFAESEGCIVYSNYASGTIENFIISLKNEYYITRYSGLVCYSNQGQIRNGYIYSGSTGGTSGITAGSGIYGGDSSSSHGYVGAIGNNGSSGLIENVFSLINISIENGTSMTYVGGLVGYNSGIVRNSFWVGDIYSYGYDNDQKQTASSLYRQGGGIVGTKSASATVENLYNISLQPDPIDYGMDAAGAKRTRNYASTEAIQRLWDFVWYDAVFSESANFDVQEQLDAGYYPKLVMSDAMAGTQDDVKLPPSSGVNIPTYISNVVKEQGADWAIVELYFNNPHLQKIKNLYIENLTAEILEQHSESSFYVVKVKLSDPKVFRSSYRLTNFDYQITETSDSTSLGNPSESAIINVKMYKQILEPTDWAQIGLDPASNYQLEADLDLSKVLTDQLLVRGTFTGELDGNGHTISNMSPSGNAAYIFEKVSGGTIRDLNVENLELMVNDSQQAKSGALYAGFIGTAEEGTKLDHIRLENVTLSGMPGAAGALAGKTNNTTVTNCRAEQVTLTTASYTGSSLRVGGLLGEIVDTPVSNSYVSSLNLTAAQGFASTGIGGLIGYASGSGNVSKAYAHGNMKVSFTSVGGAIGRCEVDVANVWTMMDISSNMGQLGGIVGVMGSGMIQNTLAIGDLATGNTSNLGRIYGGSTSGSARITMTNGIAFSGQLYGNMTSSVLDGTNATGLVSIDDLGKEDPYRDQARLGTSFDISGEVGGYPVTSGYMPMLMDSDGGILADQTPVLRKDGRLKIINVNMKMNQQGSYTLLVDVATGDSSFKLKGVECDAFELNGSSGVQNYGNDGQFGQKWSLTYSNVTLKQYLSNYAVMIVFENTEGVEQKLSYQLSGDYYRQISNAAEWVTIMTNYGQNFENFEITNNIDLSSVKQDVIEDRNLVNLKINSLRSGTGGPYKVSGLSYNAVAQGESIIASLSGTMENITFENISISNRGKALGGTNIGLIGQNNGTIQNTIFKGITVDGYSAQNVGCVGRNNGVINHVTVQDAVITSDASGAQYVGGLVGYNTGEVTDITAEGTTPGSNYRTHYNGGTNPMKKDYGYVVTGRSYTGGVIGYSTSAYSDIKLKAAYVGGVSYVGGICSWIDVTTVQNLTVGDPSDTSKAVLITGSGSYVGGVIGRSSGGAGEGVYTDIKNAKLCNAFVIGQSYTGGIIGAPGNWYTRSSDSTSIHATITGKDYIGGICGGYNYNYRNTVEDCRISGTDRVGGIQGNTGSLGEGYRVMGCTIEGSGSYVGGIVGSHGNDSIRSALVANCTIKGTQDVGGAAGYSNNSIHATSVWNTTVSGNTRVGGLVGRATGYDYYRCSVNANVSAELNEAGGVFGEVIGFNGTATSGPRQKLKAYNLIVGGTVSAGSMAGGFAGVYSVTPALRDMSGNKKAYGSVYMESDQFYRITLMNQVTCTSSALSDKDTCSVWAYFTPVNSVSSLVAGTDEYDSPRRIDGIIKKDGSNNEGGAVWSGVKVKDASSNEIYSLKTYLASANFQSWSDVKSDSSKYVKNVVVDIEDLKTEDFWNKNQRSGGSPSSNYMITGAVSGKYDSAVVTAGRVPLFHNNWYVVLSDRDAEELPVKDDKGNAVGTTILPFLSGTETYTAIEKGAYVLKTLPVFEFPTSGNTNWKGTSTTTLIDGENLMVYASDVASLNLEVADEVVEAGVAAAQSGVAVRSDEVAWNRAVVLGDAAAQDGEDEQAVQVDAAQTGAVEQAAETTSAVDPIMLVVSDSQGMIFATPVTQKVYTIPYDFSTSLTAELIQGDVVQQYEISARNLVHTVMNYDGDYYYMTGSGIRSSAWADDTAASKTKTTSSGAAGNSASADDQEETVVQGLCEGQFLNMWAGKALDVNGDIWDLATRTVEEHSAVDRDAMAAKAEAVMNASVSTLSMDGAEDGANGVQSVIEAMAQLADTESQPLYQFQYGDITLEVYGKDTISVRGGEENTLDSLVYVKNGYLYPVDNELDTVTGAVLADAYGDNRYLSVLTSEGVIQDLGNDLTLPDGFKNCSIAELADNLESDSRVAIGRYKNGTAFAFDYMTGKTIDLYEDEYDTGNDVGIFDYAKDWIVSKTGSWFGLNNSGYKGAQDMIAQYQKGGSDGILGQLRQIERTITTWKDGSDTTGTADGKDGTASGVDNTEGTDGAGLTGDAEQNGGLNQSKAADQNSDQKDGADLTDSSDTTTADGSQNIADASSEKKDSEKANADKADAQEKDSKNAGDKKQSGDQTDVKKADQTDAEKSGEKSGEKIVAENSSENSAAAITSAESTSESTGGNTLESVTGNTGDKSQADGSDPSTADRQGTDESGNGQKSDEGQAATGDSQSNQASEAEQTAKDGQQAQENRQSENGQKVESGDQTATGEKSESGDQTTTGEKPESGDQAAAGQQAESGDSTGADQTTSTDGEKTEASADGAETQQSQAKAKDQLVTIYNADTKSYEVYDVEDFLTSPKSEIATVSEKVKELTKQGLINNATDLKAEDTLTDTNRYGIWIYCGIAAAILLLLGYLADRKRRQWK